MKENPKSEIRNPKEGRKPKPEQYLAGATANTQVIEASGDAHEVPFSEVEANSWGGDGDTFREESPGYGSDLRERTAVFGEKIIRFASKVPQNPVNNRLIDQLVGAGTSIGANNYCEVDDAVFGKDYKQRISTCRKESKEAIFFLRMVAAAEEKLAQEARVLWREAKELNLIFGAIWRKYLRRIPEISRLQGPLKVLSHKPSLGIRNSGFGALSGFGSRSSDFDLRP